MEVVVGGVSRSPRAADRRSRAPPAPPCGRDDAAACSSSRSTTTARSASRAPPRTSSPGETPNWSRLTASGSRPLASSVRLAHADEQPSIATTWLPPGPAAPNAPGSGRSRPRRGRRRPSLHRNGCWIDRSCCSPSCDDLDAAGELGFERQLEIADPDDRHRGGLNDLDRPAGRQPVGVEALPVTRRAARRGSAPTPWRRGGGRRASHRPPGGATGGGARETRRTWPPTSVPRRSTHSRRRDSRRGGSRCRADRSRSRCARGDRSDARRARRRRSRDPAAGAAHVSLTPPTRPGSASGGAARRRGTRAGRSSRSSPPPSASPVSRTITARWRRRGRRA